MNAIIVIVCIVAAIGVLCWFISTVPLPPMVKNVLWAVMALFMIAWIYDYATGAHHFSLPH